MCSAPDSSGAGNMQQYIRWKDFGGREGERDVEVLSTYILNTILF